MESKIKQIARNNREIGMLKTVNYVLEAINQGHDVETIWHLMFILAEDEEFLND